MKKLTSIFLCAVMIFTMMSMTIQANADTITLPDGGSPKNTGYSTVKGRSSGGVDGYANITCSITVSHGGLFSNDKAIGKTESDVRSGLVASITVIATYSTLSGTNEASNFGQTTTLSDAGFTVTATAANDYLYLGTAGHEVDTETRGYWLCGTMIEV